MMIISQNARQRMSERHVTSKQIRFAIRFGEQIPAYDDATVYSFGRDSHIRGRERVPSGARGIDVVVANQSGAILTVYRKNIWQRRNCQQPG